MPFNDNGAIFSSNWNISKLVTNSSTTVTFPARVFDFPDPPPDVPVLVVKWSTFGLNYVPEAIVSWRRSGTILWYMDGAYDGTGAAINTNIMLNTMFASDGLYVVTDGYHPAFTAEVQYYIYTEPMGLL